jgi:hypothetical protein
MKAKNKGRNYCGPIGDDTLSKEQPLRQIVVEYEKWCAIFK